jgi:uncharacterized membrane protein YgcG
MSPAAANIEPGFADEILGVAESLPPTARGELQGRLMDVVLGMSVSRTDARLALVGANRSGHSDVVDQCHVPLSSNGGSTASDTLMTTIMGTQKMLAANNHRLVGVRMTGSDDGFTTALRDALANAGVTDVDVVSQAQAETAAWTIPDDPEFAMARAAALADPLNLPPEAVPTAVSPQLGSALAYSQVDDDDSEDFAGFDGFGYDEPPSDNAPELAAPPMSFHDDYQGHPEAESHRSRFMFVGSVLAGLILIGGAAFAVSIAVGVNPVVNKQPVTQQPATQTLVPAQGVQNAAPVQAPPPEAQIAPTAAPAAPPAPAPAASTPAPAVAPSNNGGADSAPAPQAPPPVDAAPVPAPAVEPPPVEQVPAPVVTPPAYVPIPVPVVTPQIPFLPSQQWPQRQWPQQQPSYQAPQQQQPSYQAPQSQQPTYQSPSSGGAGSSSGGAGSSSGGAGSSSGSGSSSSGGSGSVPTTVPQLPGLYVPGR